MLLSPLTLRWLFSRCFPVSFLPALVPEENLCGWVSWDFYGPSQECQTKVFVKHSFRVPASITAVHWVYCCFKDLIACSTHHVYNTVEDLCVCLWNTEYGLFCVKHWGPGLQHQKRLKNWAKILWWLIHWWVELMVFLWLLHKLLF